MALRATLGRAFSSASFNFRSVSCSCSSARCWLLSTSTSVRLARTQFFGDGRGLRLEIQPSTAGNWNSSRQMGTRAVIKRTKDRKLDNVINRDKKLKIVNKVKEILVNHPGRTMTLLSLGKHRKEIGLTPRRKVVSLLKKFPAVFEIYEEGCNIMCVRLTVEAEELLDEELRLKAGFVDTLVVKLRKLLMMSQDRRLMISKVAHLKKDLGLPEDWRTSILPNFPQYFKVVETSEGPAFELTSWDPLLAVSYAQKKAAGPSEEEGEFPAPPKIVVDGEEIKATSVSTKRLNLPRGIQLSKKDRAKALEFVQMPYQSPYEHNNLDPASAEAEKRACAAVHELLSLTLEKKTLVDHLTHFKKDYKFSQRIRAMLIRHPELFYVSFRGDRDSVFLREAYVDSELIDKDPLVLVKERLNLLVGVTRQQWLKDLRESRDQSGVDVEDEDDEDDEDEDDEDYESEEGEEDEEGETESSEDEDEDDEGSTREKKPVRDLQAASARPRPTVSAFRPRPREVEEYYARQNSRERERW